MQNDLPNSPRGRFSWFALGSLGVALLNVATGDNEGRPSAETLEAIHGYTMLRTDCDGWIEFGMYGEQMWVEVERR